MLRTRAKPNDKNEVLKLLKDLAICKWTTISYDGSQETVLSLPYGVDFDPAWYWLRDTIHSVFNEDDEVWKVQQRPKVSLIAVRAYQTKAVDFSPAQIDLYV